jgi:cytochrome c2
MPAQALPPAPFTQQQADEGRKSYEIECASCHKADLSGGSSPALIGATFERAWGRHTVAELYTYVKAMMPRCDGGSLADDDYTNIIAYLLSANGANPGGQELTPAAGAKIGDIIAEAPAK